MPFLIHNSKLSPQLPLPTGEGQGWGFDSIISQRNRDLQTAYMQFVRNSSINRRCMQRRILIDHIIRQPAPRFYICPKVAERYVLGYLRADRKILHSSRIEMIEDLVSVYKQVVRTDTEGLCRYEIWERVVQSPARKFYITPARAEEIIFNHNRHRYEKVRK